MNWRRLSTLMFTTALLGCFEDEPEIDGDTDGTGTTGAQTETGDATSTSSPSTSGEPSTTTATTMTSTESDDAGSSSGVPETDGGTEPMICPDIDEPCTVCESTMCADAYCDCFNNGSCVLLAQCTVLCDIGDAACNQACWTEYPAGISDGALLTHCAATTCTDACGPFVPLTPCQQCLYAECPDEMNVCISNPDCTALLECLAACDEAGCENTCYTVHQDGLADSGPVGDCSQDACLQECV